MRGLKRGRMIEYLIVIHVAPFAGAWIETYQFDSGLVYDMVAPFAGAWIET